jgi:hypothetical protein
MISALAWVSRAAVKDVPIYGQPSAEEVEEMRKAAAEGAGSHCTAMTVLKGVISQMHAVLRNI